MTIDAYPLQLIHSHRSSPGPEWSWNSMNNGWKGYHIWFVTSGKGEAFYNDKCYDLRPGDCFLIRMCEEFRATQDRKNSLSVYGIHFDLPRSTIRKYSRTVTLPPRHRFVPDIAFFSSLCERLVLCHSMNNTAHALGWLRVILSEIDAIDHKPVPDEKEMGRCRAIQKIREKIEKCPQDPPAVRALADDLGMTQDHFVRIFKRETGRTPKDLVIESKIQLARHHLLYTNDSIESIALSCGYSDLFSFSKQFKARAGLSPVLFRRKWCSGKNE